MLKILLAYYQPYKKTLSVCLVGVVLAAILELCFPMYLRYILNTIVPTGNLRFLLAAAALLLCFYLATALVNYQVALHGRMIGAKIERDLRRDLFRHVQSLSFRYFDNTLVGQLVARIVMDIADIRELIFLAPNYLLVCAIFMLGTLAILFYINWQLALAVNVLLLLKAYDSLSVNRRLKRAGREAGRQLGNLTAQATESLNAFRLVKSFHNEALESSKLAVAAENLLTARKNSFRLLAYSNTSMVFFSNITHLVIVVLGGLLVVYGRMGLSDLIAFLLYVSIFVRPVLRLNALADVYQKGCAGLQRFAQLMALQPEITDLPGAVAVGKLQGKIRFENVTFAYEGREPVIRNFNLSIASGESVAIVGSTGVGKSTLCNLLLRFYEPQQGRITIDGVDIRQMTLASLRRNIGIVQQEIFLFAASVKDNIEYGRPGAAAVEITRAAQLAEADQFIDRLPEKYATLLGERGVKLSGGQKQRLAIARVFLKNPPILLLDEATSSLDNATEKNIQGALNNLSQDRTTLVIAHRLATIRNVDRIIVLAKEGIVEQGTHAELLAARGAYYRLYMAQFARDGQDVIE